MGHTENRQSRDELVQLVANLDFPDVSLSTILTAIVQV